MSLSCGLGFLSFKAQAKPSSFCLHGLGFLRIHELGLLSYFRPQQMAELNCCSYIVFILMFVNSISFSISFLFYQTFVFSCFGERSKLFFSFLFFFFLKRSKRKKKKKFKFYYLKFSIVWNFETLSAANYIYIYIYNLCFSSRRVHLKALYVIK